MLKWGVEWLYKITKKSKLASSIVWILIVWPRIALIIIIGNAIF